LNEKMCGDVNYRDERVIVTIMKDGQKRRGEAEYSVRRSRRETSIECSQGIESV
jgi:hypothetical protein